jgi:hypothetical protein
MRLNALCDQGVESDDEILGKICSKVNWVFFFEILIKKSVSGSN